MIRCMEKAMRHRNNCSLKLTKEYKYKTLALTICFQNVMLQNMYQKIKHLYTYSQANTY